MDVNNTTTNNTAAPNNKSNLLGKKIISKNVQTASRVGAAVGVAAGAVTQGLTYNIYLGANPGEKDSFVKNALSSFSDELTSDTALKSFKETAEEQFEYLAKRFADEKSKFVKNVPKQIISIAVPFALVGGGIGLIIDLVQKQKAKQTKQ